MYNAINYNEDFTNVFEIDFYKNHQSSDFIEVLKNLVQKSIPFVIKGYTKEWECYKWRDYEYLETKFKDTPLPVEYFSKPFNDITSLSKVKLSFKEYLRQILSEQNPTLYLSELELYGESQEKEIESLNNDVKDVFYQKDLAYRLFLLGKNTITQMHYHRIYESVIHHISGPKWTFLYPTNELFYQLQPYPWYSKLNDWSKILFKSSTQEEFSIISNKLGLKGGYKVLLEPGDSLYIPIYWWHIVFGQDITVSFVDFFHSSTQKKYFSFLGLRSMNHFNLIKKNFV